VSSHFVKKVRNTGLMQSTVPVSKINVFGHRSKSSSFSKGWMKKSAAKHRMRRLIGNHAYDDDLCKTTLDESMTFCPNQCPKYQTKNLSLGLLLIPNVCLVLQWWHMLGA